MGIEAVGGSRPQFRTRRVLLVDDAVDQKNEEEEDGQQQEGREGDEKRKLESHRWCNLCFG